MSKSEKKTKKATTESHREEWTYLMRDVLTMIGQYSCVRELLRLRSVNRHWKQVSSLPLTWFYTHWSDPNRADEADRIWSRFESICRTAPYLRSIGLYSPKTFSTIKQQENKRRWELLGTLVHLERLVYPLAGQEFRSWNLPSTLTNLKHLVNFCPSGNQVMQEDPLLMSLPLLTLHLLSNSRLLEYWSCTSVGNSLLILHACDCRSITSDMMARFHVLEEFELETPTLRSGETYAAFTHAPSLRILTLPVDSRDHNGYRVLLPASVVEPLLSNPEFNRRLEYLHLRYDQSYARHRFSFSHQFCQKLTNECTSLLVLNISQQEGYYRPLTREDWRDRMMAQSASPELTESELLRRSNERYSQTLTAERQIMKVSTANPVAPTKRPQYFSSSFASGTMRLPQHGIRDDQLKTKPKPLKSLKQRVKEEIAADYPIDMALNLGPLLTGSEGFRHSLRFLVLRKDRIEYEREPNYEEFEDDDEPFWHGPWNDDGTDRPNRDVPQSTTRGPALLTARQLEESRAQCLLRFPNLVTVQFGEWFHGMETESKNASPMTKLPLTRLAEVASWMCPETSVEANLNLLNQDQERKAAMEAANAAATASTTSPTQTPTVATPTPPPTLTPSQLHQFQQRGSLSRHEWGYQRQSPFHLIRAIKLQAGLPLHPSEQNQFMRHPW